MVDCKARVTTAALAVAVMMAATMVSRAGGFATAAGQDAVAFADDSADEPLTALPPSVSAHSVGPRTQTAAGGRPAATTNIQKVSRTAKALDAASAMMATVTAADNDTSSSSYPSDLEWLLNVYNPHRWNPVMLPAASRLSVQCRDVMKVYLEALRRGSFWAAKSECARTHTVIIVVRGLFNNYPW